MATEAVARPVKILVVEEKRVRSSLEYPGKITPVQESYMAFEVPGRIVQFPVNEGQRVKKGAVLARLDPRDLKAKYDGEIAKLRQAKAEYERSSALYEAQNTSLAELQVNQRRFEVQKTSVRQAQKALQDTRLVAPFSGKIAKKLVKDFQNVQAKEPILILQDNSSLEMVINLPERDLTGSKRGLTVQEANSQLTTTFSITSAPGRQFPARIKEFSTTADPDTRTFEVTLAFNPPRNLNILPGMTTKVMLKGKGLPQHSKVLELPANAVVPDETGGSFVWLVDSETMAVQKTPVQVGELSESNVQITQGLNRGQWVAISGVHHLREGMVVRRLDEPSR